MPSVSLRNRAVLAAIPILVFALGLVGLAVNAANYRGAVSALEDRMESYVYSVLGAMEVDGAGAFVVQDDFADPRLTQPGSGLYVVVQGADSRWRSPSALGIELPQSPPAEAGRATFVEPQSGQGYFTYQYGVGWERDDGSITPFTVSVLLERGEIDRATSVFRQGLWTSLALAGIILVLAQAVILLLVFRPLGKVVRDVARIETGEAENLADEYPRELEPLARNVNRLLETEKSNQARIRNALDSLAHSLKTPLAVIQAGLPLHGGEAENSMQNAVQEMEHLVATRLQRAGTSTRRTLAAPVAVHEQVMRIVHSMEKVHSHKMIHAEVKLDESLQFYGEERDLLELAGNLVDNAFKYGKSQVRISAAPVGEDSNRPGIYICVEDDGPGIDEKDRERLLQRGARGDERVEGHGLGLAIVQELVSAYSGEVKIGKSDLGGASITVELPPA